MTDVTPEQIATWLTRASFSVTSPHFDERGLALDLREAATACETLLAEKARFDDLYESICQRNMAVEDALVERMEPPPLTVPRAPTWHTVERHYLAAHTGGCAACATALHLEVHHKLPFHDAPERELDPANFIVLCRRCHFFVGHLCNWASYNATVEADAAAWLAKIQGRP